MRVVIVGAGGVGAMAAWRLAKAGVEVIALEQFRLDHDRGSSYGDSRIVRRVYPDLLYTGLMADAYTLWDELQAQTPDPIIVRAGGVFYGPADHPAVLEAQQALAAGGVEYEVLDAAESGRRFPALALQTGEVAVYEPSMGYARASLCVRAAARLARQHGAVIREECAIVEIEPGGRETGGVRVKTQAGETIAADRLVLTAGPWAGPMLTRLGMQIPLVVTRQAYIHLRPAQHADAFEVGRFPVWIDAAVFGYGFPLLADAPGVTIGLHYHRTPTTPDTVDREVSEEDRDAVRRFAAVRFPWLSGEVVYEKVCLYTNTPDEDFVIDTLPGIPDA